MEGGPCFPQPCPFLWAWDRPVLGPWPREKKTLEVHLTRHQPAMHPGLWGRVEEMFSLGSEGKTCSARASVSLRWSPFCPLLLSSGSSTHPAG